MQGRWQTISGTKAMPPNHQKIEELKGMKITMDPSLLMYQKKLDNGPSKELSFTRFSRQCMRKRS